MLQTYVHFYLDLQVRGETMKKSNTVFLSLLILAIGAALQTQVNSNITLIRNTAMWLRSITQMMIIKCMYVHTSLKTLHSTG